MEVLIIESIHATEQIQSRLNRVRLAFPDFINDYFDSLQKEKLLSTTLAYTYDILVFLKYLLTQKLDIIKAENTTDITIDEFNKIDVNIINNYLSYIETYKVNDSYRSNASCGVKRKLESLRNLYKCLYKNRQISTLVTAFIDNPKIHHEKCKVLKKDDIKELQKVVIEGQNQSKLQKKKYHSKTAQRDLALITLIVHAGLRSSECVQLNIQDIDLKLSMITLYSNKKMIHRIPISEDVCECLNSFMKFRMKQKALKGYEDALFLSMQNKRMNVRTLQVLISKYTLEVRQMSPMQLRKTFGNNLYNETNDIILVTNMLGNTDTYRGKIAAAEITNLKSKNFKVNKKYYSNIGIVSNYQINDNVLIIGDNTISDYGNDILSKLLQGHFKYQSKNTDLLYLCNSFLSEHLRFCPECIKTGNHYIYHQFVFIKQCLIHKTDLIDKCPNCNEHISYIIKFQDCIDYYQCNKCKSYLFNDEDFGSVLDVWINNINENTLLIDDISDEYIPFLITNNDEQLNLDDEINNYMFNRYTKDTNLIIPKYIVMKGFDLQNLKYNEFTKNSSNTAMRLYDYAYLYAYRSLSRHITKSKKLGSKLHKAEELIRNYCLYYNILNQKQIEYGMIK